MEQVLRYKNIDEQIMKTFNDKPQWRNVLAVVLGVIGIAILGITWIYHLGTHFITMPAAERINLKDPDMWVRQEGYPNGFCYWFCNAEASMIHQLYYLRVGFGEEYCDEDNDMPDIKIDDVVKINTDK